MYTLLPKTVKSQSLSILWIIKIFNIWTIIFYKNALPYPCLDLRHVALAVLYLINRKLMVL